MSKYKTPFNIDPTPKNFENTGKKFRLPFVKDQPSQEKDFSIAEENSSFVIRSQVRERTPHKTTYEQSRSFIGLQTRQKQRQSMPEPLLGNEVVVGKKKSDSHMDSDKTEVKVCGKKSQLSKHKRRYMSSSRFQEDDDSETDEQLLVEKASRLPVIGENRYGNESEEEQPNNIWQSFSKGLNDYKHEQDRKKDQKIPRTRKNRALRTSSRKERQRQQQLAYGHASQNLKTVSAQKQVNKPKKSPNIFQVNRLPEPSDNPLGFVETLRQMVAPLRKGKRNPIDFYLDCFEQIKLINPFFRKAGQLGGCILLSLGKLKMVDIGRPAYTEGSALKHISVILYGRFLLSNRYNTFRKVALTGETLSEEEIFEGGGLEAMKEGRQSFHRSQARALSRSCLLTISLNRYFRMQKELNRTAYRHIAHTIDSLFKINYLNKQTHSRQQGRDRLITEPAPQSRIKKSQQFFH